MVGELLLKFVGSAGDLLGYVRHPLLRLRMPLFESLNPRLERLGDRLDPAEPDALPEATPEMLTLPRRCLLATKPRPQSLEPAEQACQRPAARKLPPLNQR